MDHVLTCEQFSREGLERLFKQTDEIRLNPKKYSTVLSDKVIATLFYEPSTRTRLSFEAAIQRLGGKNISTENAKEMSSAIKGESILDTIRVVQGYCDAIIMRHFDRDAADEAASVAKVPIISAGSGSGEHPTQALLDIYTIFRSKGILDGLSVAICGDLLFGRTIHSLIKILTLYNDITIYGLSRDELSLPEEYIAYLKQRNVKYIPCKTFDEIPKNVDVIYHTRTQTERFKDSDLKVEEFIIDSSIMNQFSNNTILMHPLPRNKEISCDVDSDSRAMYFEQSHNGMYVRMSLLCSIFE